jgi:uncharacterized protein (TIGR03086 family)
MKPAAHYDKLAGLFAEKIAAVPPDKWDAQSPCADWKAVDVVKHVSETPGMFFGFVGQEMGDVPPAEKDPAAAFASTRAKVQAALEDPAIAEVEFDGFFGKSTFAQAVDRFLCFDLLVHGWDLSRATGIDETMPADELGALEKAAEGFGDKMRGPQAFGEELTPPKDADQQTRVLAFLGRKAW